MISKCFVVAIVVVLNLIIFVWDWDLNSGFQTCKAVALLLKTHLKFNV
jgi:hypothetical protein